MDKNRDTRKKHSIENVPIGQRYIMTKGIYKGFSASVVGVDFAANSVELEVGFFNRRPRFACSFDEFIENGGDALLAGVKEESEPKIENASGELLARVEKRSESEIEHTPFELPRSVEGDLWESAGNAGLKASVFIEKKLPTILKEKGQEWAEVFLDIDRLLKLVAYRDLLETFPQYGTKELDGPQRQELIKDLRQQIENLCTKYDLREEDLQKFLSGEVNEIVSKVTQTFIEQLTLAREIDIAYTNLSDRWNRIADEIKRRGIEAGETVNYNEFYGSSGAISALVEEINPASGNVLIVIKVPDRNSLTGATQDETRWVNLETLNSTL